MGVLDKKLLLEDLEHRLESAVTAAELRVILAAAGEVCENYNVEASRHAAEDNSEGLIRLFLDAKVSEGKSAKTVDRYGYVLHRLQRDTGVPLSRTTVYHLRSYISSELDRGVAASTLDGNRSVYSAFFGWLHKEDLIARNPCANLAPIKKKKDKKLPFSGEDLVRIQDAAAGDKRDAAIIAFLLSTGCRISEVCGVDRDDVDLSAQQLIVLGKGNKERSVYIDDECKVRLRAYLDLRTDTCPALFTGRGTERMTPGGVRAMLNRVAAEAGVENVHPHRFRRTLATGLIDRGMSVQEVATILGHEKLDTTMRYVYVDQKNVEHAFRRCV